MFVEKRRQFGLVDGDKLVEGLFTVISHKERVVNVFHDSVQVDGLDLSIAYSLYWIGGTFSQQAQEHRVMVRETVVLSISVLHNGVMQSREDEVEGVSTAMCHITHMLHQAKLVKEVAKLHCISIICLVNVNIEVTENHKLFHKSRNNFLHAQTMASAILFESRTNILATVQRNWQCISWLYIGSTKEFHVTGYTNVSKQHGRLSVHSFT